MKTTRPLKLFRATFAPFFAAFAVAAAAQHPFVHITDTGALGYDSIEFGASWGDFDADGDVDIFCTSSTAIDQGGRRRNFLYQNDGTGLGQCGD